MKIERFDIEGPLLLSPAIHWDARGFFSETYNARTFKDAGIEADFVQNNHSLSRPAGVVRGLHFQIEPFAQDKLVQVVRGAILDVAVDIRRGSPTYGRHIAIELSAENWKQLWVPKGFAHGFCTLQPETEVVYKVTNFYSAKCDRGLAWDDPAIGIRWPVDGAGAILSDKDRNHPTLSELPEYFSIKSDATVGS